MPRAASFCVRFPAGMAAGKWPSAAHCAAAKIQDPSHLLSGGQAQQRHTSHNTRGLMGTGQRGMSYACHAMCSGKLAKTLQGTLCTASSTHAFLFAHSVFIALHAVVLLSRRTAGRCEVEPRL